MSRDVCGICWCPYDEDGGCGCKPAQPEAIRIADQLEDAGIPAWMAEEAADELRRLHAELEATERQVEILTDALAESRKTDTALLRQALEALEYYRSGEDYQPTPASEAIAAINEKLRESK